MVQLNASLRGKVSDAKLTTAATEFDPSVQRAEEIDLGLRAKLAQSVQYLAEVAGFASAREAELAELSARIRAAPVSAWVFCLYSKLVADLIQRPRGDVTGTFEHILVSAAAPATSGVVPLRDPAWARSWWDHLQTVLDTDRERPFWPIPPREEDYLRCEQDVAAALALLGRTDAAWYAEIWALLRMIVLASPARDQPFDGFNGASTFFFWGGAVLNANAKRTVISMIDVLAHESSHVLLFGLSAEEPLMRNDGSERYASPVRRDPRPLEGIFHACFVSTRVHRLLSRMLQLGDLDAEQAAQAVKRRQYNGEAAIASLDLINRHMEPTATGLTILRQLREYWASVIPD